MQLRQTLLALSVFTAACSSDPKSTVKPGNDLGGHLEFPTEDMAHAMPPGPDLSVGDLSVADFSMPVLPDLKPVPDLSVPLPDLSAPRDLAPLDVDAFPCGACATGTCGVAVSASMTGMQPLDWSFNTAVGVLGGAFFDATNHVAVITDDLTGRTGSIVYQNPIATDTFDLQFDFRISHANTDHADGMGFVLIKYDATVNKGYTAVGGSGGSLGMVQPLATGASHPLTGYGVELDGYDNDNPSSRCGESVRGAHVNIDTLAACNTGSNGTLPTPVGAAQAFEVADGMWHTALIKLANGKLSVTIQTNGNNFPLLLDVALPGFVAGEQYFYGFTGSTGGFSERHEIRNFVVTFPTQRCL
jgi:hypothetical protein